MVSLNRDDVLLQNPIGGFKRSVTSQLILQIVMMYYRLWQLPYSHFNGDTVRIRIKWSNYKGKFIEISKRN